jgi:[acyl-carrier-protein] S-malonyltransferase
MHKQGVDLFVEIGAGKVLAGLVKRTAEGARALNVGAPAEVESFSLAI